MAEDTKLLDKCGKCGVEVRDGTAFCYNCGTSVVDSNAEPSEIDKDPGESDETAQLKEADSSARRASAALERKRSRVGSKKQTKIVWETPGSGADRLYLLICILLFVVAVAVVALTTFLR